MWPSAWRISYWDKVTLVVAACSFHMEINLAEPPERRAHALPRDDLRQTHEGSGSDHVAGQQLHPTLLQIPRQPMHGGDRRRKRVLAPTGRYNGAVQFEPTLHARERQALPALDTRTSDARGIKAEVGRRRPFVQGAVRHPPPKQLQAHMAANDGVVDTLQGDRIGQGRTDSEDELRPNAKRRMRQLETRSGVQIVLVGQPSHERSKAVEATGGVGEAGRERVPADLAAIMGDRRVLHALRVLH